MIFGYFFGCADKANNKQTGKRCCFSVLTEPLFALSPGPPCREGKRSSVAKKATAGDRRLALSSGLGLERRVRRRVGPNGFLSAPPFGTPEKSVS